jgi:hypothetical protein
MFCYLMTLAMLSLSVIANPDPGRKFLIRAKSLLRREDDSSSSSSFDNIDWSSPATLGIVIGGSVLIASLGYLLYRYSVWVPKTRLARGKTPTTAVSADERLKLLVADTKQ